MGSLREYVFPIVGDRTYRRQTRHILLASVASVLPLEGGLMDPDVWGGGSSEYTWGRVQRFFRHHPLARKNQLPMHYYTEFLHRDYVSYVGLPLTNRSWFAAMAVESGALPIEFLDSVLIVLQENFSIENVERRLWEMLANDVVTPLMRMLEVSRPRVLFFERIADRSVVLGEKWPFAFREPTYLDPVQFDLYIKEYEKR
jgi:hypothetical protein